MDRIDRHILAELQQDGRLSLTELAERVGLTMSPCHRRLRTLEQAGVINGYRAQLDPAAVGLNFEALVFVTMRGADQNTLRAFENALDTMANVVSAQRLFGEPDYLLRVVATDLAAYQELYDTKIAALPGVQKLVSTLVMKTVLYDRLLPLE